MRSYGAERALVWSTTTQEEHASYAELLAAVTIAKTDLTSCGAQRGSVIAVEGAFTKWGTATLLASLELGAIVVPLTREMRPHRSNFLEIAQAQLLIEIEDEKVSLSPLTVHATENPTLARLRARGNAGLVIFSSGSTGTPKAILHDFSRILEKFEKVRQKKSTLCFLLFDHIGGVDTCLSTLANGGTLVTTRTRDPFVVAKTIEQHGIHTLPTSPTFLNLLLMSGALQVHDLSCLQVVAYGTEPMPTSTLTRLREALPDVALVQTYGMSELGVLRSRSKGSDSTWLEFTKDNYDFEVRDGVLWVKADSAMLGYLNAPDLFDENGWLNTQDAVEVDGNYLRILGRASDLINVGGQKVYPNEVEGALLEMPNVKDVSVYGKDHPMMGKMVAARVVLFQPETLSDFKLRMHAFCRTKLAPYQIPRLVELTKDEQFGARFKKLRKEE